MEAPSTPSCLTGNQTADFTRPLDLVTPNIGERLPKRSQREHITAPEPLPYGGKARKSTTATAALQEGIEASISDATRTAAILKDFATLTDVFASGYMGQKEQQIAEAVANTVARALVAFYQESFASGQKATQAIPKAKHAPTYATITKGPANTKAGPSRAALEKGPQKTPRVSREDHRVLIALPSALLRAREEAYPLRRRLVEKISGLTMAKLPAITPTRTGWALSPSDLATRDLLLAQQAAVLEASGGHGISVPEVWYDYVAPLIPAAFHGVLGEVLVTPELVMEEAFNQTGETPVRCNISRHGANPNTGKASWIISFKKKVRPFHIFNTWSQARLIDKKPRLNRHSIGGCQGWCNPAKCTRAPLCGHCGSKLDGHDGPAGENCRHKAKCANCWGPHEASHDNCPARPKNRAGSIVRPTKAELRRIRQAGRLAALAASAASLASSPSSRETSPSLAGRTPSPSPSPPVQPQGTKRPYGAHIAEYENAGSTPTSTSAPTSSTSLSSSRPVRAASKQQNLNVKILSRNSLQSNAYSPLSDDEMDEASY
jgi:hypothetical protein